MDRHLQAIRDADHCEHELAATRRELAKARNDAERLRHKLDLLAAIIDAWREDAA